MKVISKETSLYKKLALKSNLKKEKSIKISTKRRGSNLYERFVRQMDKKNGQK